MERLIVYVDRDPAGVAPTYSLTDHYQAHTFIGGARFASDWWRTPEKAIAKLVEAIAPTMLATAVLRVERYADALDPRLALVVDVDPEMPIGAIVTRAPIAKRCMRCSHYECPCCTTWCDDCLRADDDDWTRDGDWWVRKDDPTRRIHAACERESRCAYDVDPTSDDAANREEIGRTLYDAGHERWPHGGAFGVTDDGRIWYGPANFGSSEWDRMAGDMRLVRRAETLLRYVDQGRTRRRGYADTDGEILRGLLRLAAVAYDPNAIRGATLRKAIATLDDRMRDRDPKDADVRFGIALAIETLGQQLADLNEPPPPPVQGSDDPDAPTTTTTETPAPVVP